MSAPAPPPLTQAAADFESDSESLGTPVDPPTAVQPHVAGYGPLGEYYYAGAAAYDNTEYAVGHPELHYRYSDPGFVGAAAQQGLLLGPAYVEAGLPEDCSRNNSIMSSYRWSGSGRGATHGQGDLLGGCAQEGIPDSSSTGSSPSLAPAIHRDELRSQYTATSLQYADCDREHATFGENIQNISSYALARSRQPGLVCDTNVGYPLSGSQRLHSSPDQNVLPAAAIFPQSYYDEGYVESSIDDSLHCDAFANSGMALHVL
ncbi:hypothetical protein C8Q78DRAFT_505849 [Trametes maxima]|nr:hypothetical protein C8Q78DRAFT_505849 [Trametes maxima]